MRKIIFETWISMDGFAADAQGTTAFFESPELNKDSDRDQLKWVESIDTILLGANTYRMFVDFWPTEKSDGELMAKTLNDLPKIVFSKTLTNAPWGDYEPAQVINSDATSTLKELKAKSGKDMVLWGSLSLAQTLMKGNIIDELRIRIVPVVLGEGRPLFENTGPLEFKLEDAKQYDSGLMFLKYVRR